MAKFKPENIIDDALNQCRGVLWVVFFFSFFANVLVLALPIYSLQVLNRVLSSGSYTTLYVITGIIVALFAGQALFGAIRTFTLVRMSEWIEDKLSPQMVSLSIATAAQRPVASGSQNMRDLSAIKSFLTGAGIITLFDFPWVILFLIVIFIIHPVLAIITLLGGIVLLVLAVINENATKPLLEEANETAIKSLGHIEIATRNAESVEAMGMSPALIREWKKIQQKVQFLQSKASQRAGIIGSATKFIRLLLQAIVLGTGAHLVLSHQMTAGGIIAASILVGRALAPFEQAIGFWKSLVDARKSYSRLKKNLSEAPVREKAIQLPTPTGQVSVSGVLFGFPSQPTKPVLRNVNFEVKPGECIAIIGPSASGKSTLAKILVGVWKPNSGSVRLDNADVFTWNREDFGKHVGYLPQDIELFRDRVRDNIARMDENAKDEDIIKAAQMAGAHDFILLLPKGYETDIGVGGAALSGGQRQRVALARAFFGDPKLVVLDEPNANLDDAGEAALLRAINNAKAKKISTIVISHRQSVLAVADKLVVMKDGMVEEFGPTKEVLNRYAQKVNAAKAAAAEKPANPAV